MQKTNGLRESQSYLYGEQKSSILEFPMERMRGAYILHEEKIMFSVPASLHHTALVHLKDGDLFMEEKCKTKKYVQTGDSDELKEAGCCCTPIYQQNRESQGG